MSETSHQASMPALMNANSSTASAHVTTRLEARRLARGDIDA
jgi:hypothetical protein